MRFFIYKLSLMVKIIWRRLIMISMVFLCIFKYFEKFMGKYVFGGNNTNESNSLKQLYHKNVVKWHRKARIWKERTIIISSSSLIKSKAISITKDERPLILTIDKLSRNYLPITHRGKHLLIIHLLHPLLKETQHNLIEIVPPSLEQAIDKKSNGFYPHIPHHHLINPLIYNWLKIDRIVPHLPNIQRTILFSQLGKYYLMYSTIFFICCWKADLVRLPRWFMIMSTLQKRIYSFRLSLDCSEPIVAPMW